MGNIIDKQDEATIQKSETFIKHLDSNMYFKSELYGNSMSLDWLKEIEYACPYIDNIIRKPKLALISEENVVKIEKARKITVASVKDLTRHTQFIDEIDKVTEDVKPSKILDVRGEDTFNTYENRFAYTLINNLTKFVLKQEEQLEDFETNNKKTMEYNATTVLDGEKIDIELKINSTELPKKQENNNFMQELAIIKPRIKRIKDYMASWRRSDFMKSLEKAHVPLVIPPINKTNVILKNPNFQIAMKLWTFLQNYGNMDEDNSNKNLDSKGNNVLEGLLDHSFLIDYIVLDSISSTKKEEKDKLSKYATIMINQEIGKIIQILLNCGVKITDEEILSMVANAIKKEKQKRLIGSQDVKKKFKNAMEEYLEKMQEYL